MPVAEFPMPSTNPANPPLVAFTAIPEKFSGAKTVYDDGGVDTALQHGGVGELRWQLSYKGLNPTWAAILDSHFNSAKWLEGENLSAFTFNFRDRDTGVLYAGVRYSKYEVSHSRTHIQHREIELVRFP